MEEGFTSSILIVKYSYYLLLLAILIIQRSFTFHMSLSIWEASIEIDIYHHCFNRHLFARKPFQLWFNRKILNKQKGDFTIVKHNSINNFNAILRVNICFANTIIITIILFHFSKQYTSSMVRIFYSNILRLLTSNQLRFLTSNHVITKYFFQELRFQPTLKLIFLEKVLYT